MAKLSAPVETNGHEVFHAGDPAQLRLGQTASDRSGKPDSILELVSIQSGGRTYAVSSGPFLIKGGFLRKKKVGAGTRVDFTLRAPLTISPSRGN